MSPYVDSFRLLLPNFFIWWFILLIFQRFVYRYKGKNSWTKDIVYTGIQAALLLLFFELYPVIVDFFKK